MADDSHAAQHLHRRALHGKRSFKHGSGLAVDSPLYDASEEDNDEMGDDASSVSVMPSPNLSRNPTATSPLGPNANARASSANPSSAGGGAPNHTHNHVHRANTRPSPISKVQSAAIQPIDNEALYSPNDGDIESSTTALGGSAHNSNPRPLHPHAHTSHLSTSTFGPDDIPNLLSSSKAWDSSTSTASSIVGAPSSSMITEPPTSIAMPSAEPPIINVQTPRTPGDVIATPGAPTLEDAAKKKKSLHAGHSVHPLAMGEPEPADITVESIDPSALTPDAIRAFVQAALDGTSEIPRAFKPNPPPTDRPVRIYADGVYDIFHFGHALQLRQAKLSFPSVHLLVGVCSDDLCVEHKSRTVMNHAERCESVRHCRWVDEIVSDAPWVIDQEFLDKHEIDYVAHDEDPYKGSDGSDDVYYFPKSIGRFVPTRRTPGVSTSELLERIVAGYREGQWDPKLIKSGHPELASRAPSRAPSRAASRPESRVEGQLSPTGLSPTAS